MWTSTRTDAALSNNLHLQLFNVNAVICIPLAEHTARDAGVAGRVVDSGAAAVGSAERGRRIVARAGLRHDATAAVRVGRDTC